MKLQVLMAKEEGIVKGKRIDFELDAKSRLYIASCEGKAFGIAKRLLYGKTHQLRNMGDSFSGVAVKVLPGKRHMEVKIAPKKGKTGLAGKGKQCRKAPKGKAVRHEGG